MTTTVLVTVDEWQEKKLMTYGQQQFLQLHENEVQHWLDDNIADYADWMKIYRDVMAGNDEFLAYIFYLYFSQKQISEEERFRKMCTDLNKTDGFICVVIGEKETGKTALAYTIAEYLHSNFKRKIWWLGPPTTLPPFVEGQTISMNAIPENTIVIYDEASLHASSRTSMKKEQVEETRKLAVTRHTSRNYIVITQSAAIIDLNFLRQATCLLFTSPFFLHIRRERLVINRQLNYFMPKQKGEALYFDSHSLLEIKVDLPKWWHTKYSKPYHRFTSDAEVYRYLLALLKDTQDTEMLQDYLDMRGWQMQQADLEFFRMLATTENLHDMPNVQLVDLARNGYYDTTINELIGNPRLRRRYNFTQSEIMKEYWRQKIEKNPDIDLRLRLCKNRMLIDLIKKTKQNDHVICSIYGLTGSKKSSASISLAECICQLLGRSYKGGNEAFTNEEFLEEISKRQRHDVIILDEQIKRHGTGSAILEAAMKNAEETLRIEQVSYIFNGATVRTHLHRFILETYAVDEHAQKIKLVMYTPDMQPIGYITLDYASPQNWNAYMQKKIRFASQMKAQAPELRSTSPNIAKQAQQIVKDPQYQRADTVHAKWAVIMTRFGVGIETAKLIKGMADTL